jgi:hypothetical protein
MTVYFALAVRTGQIKIGCSRTRDGVERRLRAFERALGEPVVLLAATFGGRRVEAWWHRRHAGTAQRHPLSRRRTEWFSPSALLLADLAWLNGAEVLT